MFANYFQLSAIPIDQYNGAYDLRLVALSFLVAVFASYIAVDLTGRLRDIDNTPSSSALWLIGGAIAMGSGIWAMHFIGMLSFSIPGLTLQYDMYWTVLSLLVAIFASGFALYLLQSSKVRTEHYIAGGVVLGFAIAAMHYTGMEALFIILNVRYLPMLFLISILIAIIASEAALWFALKSNQVTLRIRNRIKLISATIMGIAICGMHYTGMAASIFTPLCVPNLVASKGSLDPTLLSLGIFGITFVILSIAFFASSYKEALNQQQFERARQLGMAEISSSILHNVGNILNSVTVSAYLVTEKNLSSKLVGLEQLSALFNEHKEDLTTFLTKDPRGAKALEFLDRLAEYWRKEQKGITEEMERLNTNIAFIKDIINTQQDLNKVTNFEQMISINELLDEALLITGLDIQKVIIIEKNYSKFKPVKLDKVKLLQVFINLIRNAKDAIVESSNHDKKIILKTSVNQDKIIIEISDTGVGIQSKNIKRIFNYGLTTKESGHGFGLHASAIAINILGGSIEVKSEGHNKGATFIIKLPVTKV